MRKGLTCCLTLGALAIACVLVPACAPSSLEPMTFPLSYRFMGSLGDIGTAPECAQYDEIETFDGREDKAKVGARYLEEGQRRHDVGIEGDVEAWLAEAAEKVVREASIEQEDDSGHTVSITLERITTDEAVYRQAEYDGKVVLRIAVTGGGADWKGTKDGFAENYGRPGSATNYQETLNHALDRALTAMVNDQGFRDALCQ